MFWVFREQKDFNEANMVGILVGPDQDFVCVWTLAPAT